MEEATLADARTHAVGVAYRLLGSYARAEEFAQEALIRCAREPALRSPRAFLTTVVTRLCLDELRSAPYRREAYVGPWLPEPVLTAVDAVAPDARIGRLESLSMAFLLLLERLSPPERAALVLRDVFDVDYAELAETLDRSEAACRQLVRRARGHVALGRKRYAAPADCEALFARFLMAVGEQDLATVVALLQTDATAVSDHGGKARAALRTILGAEKVGRFLLGLVRKQGTGPFGGGETVTTSFATVNGCPAVVLASVDKVSTVLVLEAVQTAAGPRFAALHFVRNPDKLGTALGTVT